MILYLTYCSAKKRRGIHLASELYVSARISHFIDWCKAAGVDWAIFSALHGLFFPDQKERNYDVTFKTDNNYWLGIAIIKEGKKLSSLESRERVSQLGEKLRMQAEKHDVSQIVFYGPSPKMMKCYLSVLHYVFDGCTKTHSWRDLIEHVTHQSKKIKVVHTLSPVSDTRSQ
jgi:hypothetical protein